jgi:hypothetical protein
MGRTLDVYIGDDIVGQLVQDDGGRRRVPKLADTVVASLANVEIAHPTAEKVAAG